MINLDFKTVLVVAAHPDDEILGCGATMTRLARAGCAVHIAILGEGLNARGEAAPEQTARLRADARAAAGTVGAKGIAFFDHPDNRFDSVPLLDVVRTVEGEIARVRPDAVFTHHDGDLNVDHVITHRAVITATRPTGAAGTPRSVFTFEVPSSSEWAFGQFGAFRPSVFVDVTDTLEQKVRALACYQGESRPFPHPRSPELLEALAWVRGSAAGVAAAEAFELVRALA